MKLLTSDILNLTTFLISIVFHIGTSHFPAGNYLFKVNKNSGILIVNFEHISHLVLVSLLLTLSRYMLAGLRHWTEVGSDSEYVLHDRMIIKYRDNHLKANAGQCHLLLRPYLENSV